MAHSMYYLPSWGQLPIEQYLIESWNWTPTPPEPPPAQRARLIKQFITLHTPIRPGIQHTVATNHISNPRVSTEEEIATILRPWRSDDMRQRAWTVWYNYSNGDGNNPVLLRTWYSGDPADDERVKSWATLPEEFADDAEWAILDNKDLFAVGENDGQNWTRVYQILPEIVVPYRGVNPWKCTQSEDDWPTCKLSEFRQQLDAVKRLNPTWREDLNVLVTGNIAAPRLLHLMSYILIADKETFDTDQFLLAYLDAKGRVTMQGRISLMRID